MLRFEGINNINDIEHLKGDYIYQERDARYRIRESMNIIIRIYWLYSFKDDDTPIGG